MTTPARTDAFTFYALGVISFLESAVPHYVDNLQPYFNDCPETIHWLRETWLPEESRHGRMTRIYLQAQWPEFDWAEAYSTFVAAYAPRCDHWLLRPSQALEALARCVTETEAAMIYRCLSAYTSDHDLKAILDGMSRDEVRHYSYFKDLFDRYDKSERNSLYMKAKTIIARSELVRDEDLALAFRPLNDAWRVPMPFRALSYKEFLEHASSVLSRHFPIEAAKRMLFRPLRTGRVLENAFLFLLATMIRRQYGVEA